MCEISLCIWRSTIEPKAPHQPDKTTKRPKDKKTKKQLKNKKWQPDQPVQGDIQPSCPIIAFQGEALDGPWDYPIWLGFVQGGRGGRKVAQTRDLVHFPLYFILRLVNVGCGGWGEYLTCERWTWACMIWHEGVIDDVTKSLLLKLNNVSNTWGCCAWSWLREWSD